jgi:hypothetical protein
LKIFASSDWQSLPPGVDWYNTIDKALRDCTLGIILVTEGSFNRPWINYELGALRYAGKKTIPICAEGIDKGKLPSPLDRSQACNYSQIEDRLKLLKSIGATCKYPSDWNPLSAAKNAPILPVVPPVKEPEVGGSSRFALEDLFEVLDRWTTVIYTCRATFVKGEECRPDGPIRKALWTHVPVDEVQTLCLALNHLRSAEARAQEEDVIHTVMCSKRAQELLLKEIQSPIEHGVVPPLLERNLVIIGENNFGNPLLHMMAAYLPWQAHVGAMWPDWRPHAGPPRPDVHVKLVPRFNVPTRGEAVHKGGGMIAVFPNPFNVRKKVLLLFGCHREGQFTLESWLRGEEIRTIVDSFHSTVKDRDVGAWALQIIVNRVWRLSPTTEPIKAEAITNPLNRQPFWFARLSRESAGDAFIINKNYSEPHDLYDLSVVAILEPEYQRRLREAVSSRARMPELYWEDQQSEVGFHITLFEFCTHHSDHPQLLAKLMGVGEWICRTLSRTRAARPNQIQARLRGIDMLPSALVSYVDFLDEEGQATSWLDSVRSWCEECVGQEPAGLEVEANLLNLMRVPFPVHVTLCRFDRELPEPDQINIRELVARTRSLELFRFPIRNLTLTVARRSPYRNVKRVTELKLREGQDNEADSAEAV